MWEANPNFEVGSQVGEVFVFLRDGGCSCYRYFWILDGEVNWSLKSRDLPSRQLNLSLSSSPRKGSVALDVIEIDLFYMKGLIIRSSSIVRRFSESLASFVPALYYLIGLACARGDLGNASAASPRHKLELDLSPFAITNCNTSAQHQFQQRVELCSSPSPSPHGPLQKQYTVRKFLNQEYGAKALGPTLDLPAIQDEGRYSVDKEGGHVTSLGDRLGAL